MRCPIIGHRALDFGYSTRRHSAREDSRDAERVGPVQLTPPRGRHEQLQEVSKTPVEQPQLQDLVAELEHELVRPEARPLVPLQVLPPA